MSIREIQQQKNILHVGTTLYLLYNVHPQCMGITKGIIFATILTSKTFPISIFKNALHQVSGAYGEAVL
jgi:hypothetical protein